MHLRLLRKDATISAPLFGSDEVKTAPIVKQLFLHLSKVHLSMQGQQLVAKAVQNALEKGGC